MARDETPTPRQSGTYGAFQDASQALIDRIGERRGFFDVLRAEATRLRDEFALWPTTRPSQATRNALIQRLLDLHEQVRVALDGSR